MIFEGVVRRFTALKSGKSPLDARLTHQESVATASVEPVNFEMTRAGRRFFLGNSAAATGIAPVQAIPTTAAQWVIWNADTTKSYFFEELGVFLTSGTPGLGGSLWISVFNAPAQVGSNATGMTVQSASQGGLTSKAVIKSVITVTSPAAPAWFPIDQSIDAITAAAFSTGYGMTLGKRDLAGAIAIQPGQGLGFAVIGPAGTTPLFAPFARWIEQETDME